MLRKFLARRRLNELLLAEEARSRPSWARGPPRLRTARKLDYAYLWEDATDAQYEYRTVLRSEVVFDMGDEIKGMRDKDAGWRDLARRVHALWDVLNVQRVPYWGALSGGEGVHTHVFLEPLDDPEEGWRFRKTFAQSILFQAQRRFMDDLESGPFNSDPALLHPPWRSQLVREFGAVKRPQGTAKTLWIQGPGSYRPLESTRIGSYKQTDDLAVPERLELAREAPGILTEQVRSAFGGCPRSADCWNEVGVCDGCPATS